MKYIWVIQGRLLINNQVYNILKYYLTQRGVWMNASRIESWPQILSTSFMTNGFTSDIYAWEYINVTNGFCHFHKAGQSLMQFMLKVKLTHGQLIKCFLMDLRSFIFLPTRLYWRFPITYIREPALIYYALCIKYCVRQMSNKSGSL